MLKTSIISTGVSMETVGPSNRSCQGLVRVSYKSTCPPLCQMEPAVLFEGFLLGQSGSTAGFTRILQIRLGSFTWEPFITAFKETFRKPT